MRLIDQQAAIDALQKEINKGIPPFDDVMGSIRCGIRLARNIIEDLPYTEPRWIPCQESLPEPGEMVLVTTRTKKGRRDVNRAYYMNGAWHGAGSMAGVVAWMPLPKPWGGGSR